MSNAKASGVLAQGIHAAKSGNRLLARLHLQEATESDPTNPQGWVWLAWVSESPEKAAHFLQKAVSMGGQDSARAGLAWVTALAATEGGAPAKAGPLQAGAARTTSAIPSPRQGLPAAAASSQRPTLPPAAPRAPVAAVSPKAPGGLPPLPPAPSPRPQSPATAASQKGSPAPVRPASPTIPNPSAMSSQAPANSAPAAGSKATPAPARPAPAAAPQEPKVSPPAAASGVAPGIPRPQMPLAPAASNPPAAASPANGVPVKSVPAPLRSDAGSVEPVMPPLGEKRPAGANDKQKVLVIDDSPTICKLVAITLKKAGYEVLSARDGVEALLVIAESHPDLLVLDIAMPRMDGYQVCKVVKGHPATNHIPIIMLSGKDAVIDKDKAQQAGAADYIVKPFDPTALTTKVRSHLQTPVGAT